MASDADLTLHFASTGKAGRGILTARLAGQAIHTDKLDLTEPDRRARFLNALCAERAGIDRAAVAQHLEELAGKCVGNGDDPERDKITQSQAVVKLSSGAELFHDGDTGYATVEAGADAARHRETYPVKGNALRNWLQHRYYKAFAKPIGGQAMQDALDTLDSMARYDGSQLPVAVRIAQAQGAIYLDLANERWEAVKVTALGWGIAPDSPVKFIRKRGMLPLPMPQRGGTMDALRPLLNAGDDEAWRLMVSWLVGALRPTGPYAILAVNGEQGSAKSTTCRMLRRLIDPNEADLRAAQRDERDLMIAAGNAWIMAFDNLSTIPAALSDSLCRIATGGGFATRELFTDDGEKLIHVARPILFNGIEELATRPDLLERAIVLNLPAIRDDARKTEAELWERYEVARPFVLGALLDAVSAALCNFPSVVLAKSPRMADFARWVVAAEPALPWKLGGFLAAYAGNRSAANELALESSAVGPAVLAMIEERYTWEGTAKELLDTLELNHHFTDARTRSRPDWPKTPKGLSNALHRIAPTLRRNGVRIEQGNRQGKARRRVIRLERIGETPSASSAPSASDDFVIQTPFLADDGQQSPDDCARLQDACAPATTANRPPKNPLPDSKTNPADHADGADGHLPLESKRPASECAEFAECCNPGNTV